MKYFLGKEIHSTNVRVRMLISNRMGRGAKQARST